MTTETRCPECGGWAQRWRDGRSMFCAHEFHTTPEQCACTHAAHTIPCPAIVQGKQGLHVCGCTGPASPTETRCAEPDDDEEEGCRGGSAHEGNDLVAAGIVADSGARAVSPAPGGPTPDCPHERVGDDGSCEACGWGIFHPATRGDDWDGSTPLCQFPKCAEMSAEVASLRAEYEGLVDAAQQVARNGNHHHNCPSNIGSSCRCGLESLRDKVAWLESLRERCAALRAAIAGATHQNGANHE